MSLNFPGCVQVVEKDIKINDGGPAFPAPDVSYDAGFARVDIPASQGMSLRDWFAGMALNGILAANAKLHEDVSDKNVDDVVARESYLSADAMIARREQS